MNINFLTGPVTITSAVQNAYSEPPISHRSDSFIATFNELIDQIKYFTNTPTVVLMMGSGTLANDAIAAQLKHVSGSGMILSNGEFGNRLIRQGTQAGLSFTDYQIPIGTTFNFNAIEKILARKRSIHWIWMTVHETSSSTWNDYETLRSICEKYDVLVALDCISAFGIKPMNLKNIYLASGVSGKALASFPGLCFVTTSRDSFSKNNIPQYLDLNYYQQYEGIPFTINTNNVIAFHQAMQEIIETPGYEKIEAITQSLRTHFLTLQCKIINSDHSAPNALTIELPSSQSGLHLGNNLAMNNCAIGYKSKYLLERNWIQLFITRNNTKEEATAFQNLLASMI